MEYYSAKTEKLSHSMDASQEPYVDGTIQTPKNMMMEDDPIYIKSRRGKKKNL